MKKNIIIIFLCLALAISLVGNILTYQKEKLEKPNLQVSKPENPTPRSPSIKAKNQDVSLLSVYVLPHPPDFLEGRRIYFKDYYIQNLNNKQIIIFNEIKNDEWVETKVDSEAVRWK